MEGRLIESHFDEKMGKDGRALWDGERCVICRTELLRGFAFAELRTIRLHRRWEADQSNSRALRSGPAFQCAR